MERARLGGAALAARLARYGITCYLISMDRKSAILLNLGAPARLGLALVACTLVWAVTIWALR